MPLPFLEDLIPVDFRVDDRPRAGKYSLLDRKVDSARRKREDFVEALED
jgi:hypothetical protein